MTQPRDIVMSRMKLNRRRRRAELEYDSRIENMDVSETSHFYSRPLGHLSWTILFCCFLLQALSFVTDKTPAVYAFVPHSNHCVSTETIPSSAKRTSPQLSTPISKTRKSPSTAISTTALFGIKGFRTWFEDQFPNAVSKIDVSQHQDTFDHVLIDMNQILHVVFRRSQNTERATKLLMVELDTLIQRCKPTQSLVLAIDGSAAAAKLATQRKRRYSILKNTEFKLKHADKLRMSKRRREKRLRNYKSELQSLQLTPGTETMKTLESAILYWAWQRLQSQGKPHSKLLPKVRIYISSSQAPGEGEIKLLEWINNYRGQFSRYPGQSIALIGGDADLLLEAMVIPPSWTHNVFVLRPEDKSVILNTNKNVNPKETRQLPKKGKKAPLSGVAHRDVMHCTSLWEIILSLDDYCRKHIEKEFYNPEENPEDQNLLLQIRTDMVLLFILNGNDYLPRVVAVGFRSVLKSYLVLLENYIRRSKSNQNVGLIDPNTLNFRSDFCADFFGILGAKAPSDQDRMRSIRMASPKRTYQSILNDMSAIGFIPTPVLWDQLSIDDVELQGEEEIEVQDDLFDEDDIDFDEDIDDDDGEVEDDEENLEANKSSSLVEILQLTLGSKQQRDFHQYRVRFDLTSSSSLRKAKQKLAKMALKDFDLLKTLDESGDAGKEYDWEIAVPASANIDRYLAGLIWTLQSYQDGVCPTYHYNYGKCMAPTGREISSYFLKAMDENRDVGTAELLSHFEPGGSISAGVACLAALPISVKEIVPKPYSLLEGEVVEEIYSQCMDPTDNFFHLKKFETLIDAKVERLAAQTEGTSREGGKNITGELSSRHILLGDHYWTVLKRTQQPVPNPFTPPPPPVPSFSRLRTNNRIKAGRIICMDVARNSLNRTMPDSTKSNYPRKFWNQNNIEIDHLNFGSLMNGSKFSVLEMPYKVAFGASPKKYGESQNSENKSSFKLLKSDNINLSKILKTDINFFQYGREEMEEFAVSSREGMEEFTVSNMTNIENQTAIAVLRSLENSQLVEKFTFSESDGECILTVSFDEANGGIPMEDMSFSFAIYPNDPLKAIKQYLASLALDTILLPGEAKKNGKSESEIVEKPPTVRWFNMTVEDMKKLFMIRYPALQATTIVPVNIENTNSLVIFKQLCDVGVIEYFEFNEAPPSKDNPAKTSLSFRTSSLTMPSEKMSFARYRTGRSKKWTKQYLMSLALDAMVMASTEDDDNSTTIHWYDLSYKELKRRIGG